MKIKLLAKCLFALSIAFLFASCSTLISDSAKTTPYVIGGKCALPSDTNNYMYAGFDFVFFNSSDKHVSNFTIVFYVYDEEGNSPFVGTNCVIKKCNYSVPPKSEIEGEISLDEYITSIPDVAYDIENIYVSEINYTDGSVWRDNFGLYAY